LCEAGLAGYRTLNEGGREMAFAGNATFGMRVSRLLTRVAAAAFGIANARAQNAQSAIRSCWLSFGPQHPAAHGIVRLNLQLHGEVLLRVDPQFGLLHRGTEKLAETRSFLQVLPYFDRFDYVANLFQEHAYCLGLEALPNEYSALPFEVGVWRTFFDELSRVLNHLLTLSATSLDLSAMGPIFWAFEERERIMELFERVSGARMHTALYQPYGFEAGRLTRRF
jgi:NADH:ubiquinone oxidoreductase subunit D